MSRFRLTVVVAAVTSLAAGAAVARVSTPDPLLLAQPDIRAVASSERPGALWRAVVGVEWGVPYLVIEQFRRGRVARRADLPNVQQRIQAFRYEHGVLSFAGHAEAVEDLQWRPRSLAFQLVTDTGRLSCRVPIRGSDAFVARCDSPRIAHDTPRTARPAPANWAADPGVIRACGDAFYGAANEAACLDLARDFSYRPAALIRACDAHMYGDANALECVRSGRVATGDPSRLVKTCDDHFYGDGGALSCLAVATRASYDAATVVAACDDAMYGDGNALKCLEAAVRARRDVSRTVRVCDEAMTGDAAALSCLRRGVSL